ncbi:MAG: FAD-binding protein [Spirochaetales bacterium]|nr:MAG: FAD-binding protein [Spirochaetales bacterium]
MQNSGTENVKTEGKVGSVLVVGAGIAGVQASLDLADSGFKVILVEQKPAIGGIMAQLDKTFPTNDCSMCIVSPKLVDCSRHHNIKLYAYSEVEGITGTPGNYTVRLKKKARFVEEHKCTGCAECAKHCPVTRPNEFDERLAPRQAIYRPFPQATPNVFVVEKRATSPCTLACPAGCNAHGYVALIRAKKFKEALALVREKIPLPGVCGRVCGFCEDACNREKIDDPIRIRALKRYIADYEINNKEEEDWISGVLREKKAAGPLKEKVAVIGSGPAGLTAAHDLARLNFQVTIFEARQVTGGMLRIGIPGYRLPDDILDYEIDLIKKLGVEIRLASPLGKKLTLKNLKDQGFKAVFLAVGKHGSRRMAIEGEDLSGVIPGVAFLRDVYGDKDKAALVTGKKVAVIGGGNTAIDAVRSALRMGAKEAFIVYRRTREEMPVNPEEIEAAEEEGIKIHYLLAPEKITPAEGKAAGGTIAGKPGTVDKLVCTRMKLGGFDASGRRRPVPVPGSQVVFEVDIVIPALGQEIDFSMIGDALNDVAIERDLIKVDPVTLATNLDGVFSGGDASGSEGLVVHAIAHGHEAAVSIDRYLRGEDVKAGRKMAPMNAASVPDRIIPKNPSRHLPLMDPDKRAGDFSEAEFCFSEEQAVEEASRCLDCGVCCNCYQCVIACEAKAVNHNQKDVIEEIEVGSVILTPGCELSNEKAWQNLGYDTYPNVITSLQFERTLSASGPFGGHIQRPSDGGEPKHLAFIQCVGSRDKDHPYCSSVCCMYALKEAIIAKEHDPEIECEIFYMDIRAYGKGFDAYFERAKELGIRFTRCRPLKIEQVEPAKNLRVGYVDEKDGTYRTREFNLVILSAGFKPQEKVQDIADIYDINLTSSNFAETLPFNPVGTSRRGVFVSGPFAQPKDIPETVMEASSAAANAMVELAEVRGTEVEVYELPPERDIRGEAPRVGVFVCHCGKNIGGVVDVPSVAEYAKGLPNVVYAADNLYTCSSDTQEIIKERIKEYGLNRVIVASCSPRTHEPLFQQTIREAGLNPYLFEMANIRDQCSWVHMQEHEAATDKSMDLVRMAVAKANLIEPLQSIPLKVTQKAMVVGGGVSGMTCALSLAKQGYPVFLVEKTGSLGGNALKHDRSLEGHDVKAFVYDLVSQVESHQNITVYKNAALAAVDGFVGNFASTLRSAGNGSAASEVKLEHGVAVIATGGSESRPAEYLYGSNPRVITLLELGESFTKGGFKAPGTAVFIQCVGSREPDHPYCSRVCCTGAVKQAIRMKKENPAAKIFVLYREIRTYGFREEYYELARELGIMFIRYDVDKKPEVSASGEDLTVRVEDPVLMKELEIHPDLLVLSSRIDPNPDNERLSQFFKVPLNAEKFFLEAHVKLRPVEFATDGVFLCGLAHYPKDLNEAVSQGMAASGKAAAILYKDSIDSAGKIAYVNENRCVGCQACISVCPYNAITMDEDRGVANINEAVCKGCGACTATCRSSAINLKGFKDEQILKILSAV